jgi:FkbM family methyltransferase
MLIAPHILRDLFDVAPRGVLHVGAHEAEEEPIYRDLGWGPVTWVEMLPDKAAALRQRFAGDSQNVLIEAAAWSVSGCERDVFEASNKQSSSLFRPQTHVSAHPDVAFESGKPITTRRLDEVLDPAVRPEFLNLDCQGAEVEVMKGLGDRLGHFKWCYIEINVEPLYEDIPLLRDVDAFMLDHGFTRIVQAIHSEVGWGDALYGNGRILDARDLFRLKLRGAQWRGFGADPLRLGGDDLIDFLRSEDCSEVRSDEPG